MAQTNVRNILDTYKKKFSADFTVSVAIFNTLHMITNSVTVVLFSHFSKTYIADISINRLKHVRGVWSVTGKADHCC
jgi:hypothetical protein